MEATFSKEINGSFFHSRNNIVADVNNEFIELTGFTMEELLGKSIAEIGNLMKINSQLFFENKYKEHTCYIFTKTHEVKEVSIYCSVLNCKNENIYYFSEKTNTLYEKAFNYIEYLIKDNKVGVGIFSIPDLILLRTNQKFINYKFSTNNLIENNIGKQLKDSVDNFTGGNCEKIYKEIIKTGKAYYVDEFELEDLDNGNTYWDVSAIPVVIDGSVKYVIETASDVTERVINRKIIEEQSKEIQEQKKELEAIIENISDGILIINDKKQHTVFNKNARELFFPPKDFLGDVHEWYKASKIFYSNGERVQPRDYPENRIIRGEKFSNMQVSAKFPNKRVHLQVSGTPIYDSEGNFKIGVICNRDVTEYYHQQEILKDKNDFLNRLIDKLELPVVSLSCPNLQILGVNQKAIDILKNFIPNYKSTLKIVGKPITTLLTTLEESQYMGYISEVINEKKIKYVYRKTHIINGSKVYWNVIFEPIFESNGEIQEIVVLIIDITTEINANKIMEKALKSQEEFLANISHELKTPLNVIYSAIQLFNMYFKNGSFEEKKDSISRYLDSMLQNCNRLSKLINNIVDLSKIEAGFFELNLSNNNIAEIVKDVVRSVTEYSYLKGLNIFFCTNAKDKIIACDPEKIERVVLNLISNAIKFSDYGDQILVKVEDKDEFIEISVKDHGIGIEQSKLDMIFDRFKQVDKSLSRNSEGAGIGLSLAKALVELHKGKIYAESELGNGSKFIVSLPTTKMLQENFLISNSIRNNNESIKLELSDICSY